MYKVQYFNLGHAHKSKFRLPVAYYSFSRLKGAGKRGHIVVDTLLLMMFLGRANARDTKWMLCFHAAQTGKHLLRTQNVSEQNQKHFLCPGHKICVRNKCCARGQTGKHLCRQQCVRNMCPRLPRPLETSVILMSISLPKEIVPYAWVVFVYSVKQITNQFPSELLLSWSSSSVSRESAKLSSNCRFLGFSTWTLTKPWRRRDILASLQQKDANIKTDGQRTLNLLQILSIADVCHQIETNNIKARS